MAGDADTMIDALRAGHDGLAALVSGFGDEDLARPSGSAEWDISQVLGHLGSGAEITAATVRAALDGKPNPGRDFNLTVWDRWDNMTRVQRGHGFLVANQEATALFESLSPDIRRELRIDMGFLPAPVDVATAARLRLGELALHSWDVRVEFDPAATVAPEAVGPLLTGVGLMVGWIAKPDRLDGRHGVVAVSTTDPKADFMLHLGERIQIEPGAAQQPDGTLDLPAEAWLRLVTGRLTPRYTPVGVEATGVADLDLLRRVFPGY